MTKPQLTQILQSKNTVSMCTSFTGTMQNEDGFLIIFTIVLFLNLTMRGHLVGSKRPWDKLLFSIIYSLFLIHASMGGVDNLLPYWPCAWLYDLLWPIEYEQTTHLPFSRRGSNCVCSAQLTYTTLVFCPLQVPGMSSSFIMVLQANTYCWAEASYLEPRIRVKVITSSLVM